jgi:SAM-dependent methyltransferase
MDMKNDFKRSPSELIELLWLKFRVSLINLVENTRILLRYWPKFRFMTVDFGLFLTYLFDNPFQMSKRFLAEKGEQDLHQYGETPLTTLDAIMKKAGVTSADTIYELGSGRGRTSFWLSQYLGCNTIGIEQIPAFVERANRLVQRCGLKNVSFKQENFCDSTFENATVVYLYGTCLEDEAIHRLTARLAQLPSGTKIITVSYPLNDYDTTNSFELMNCFQQPFTWGNADVFLHIVK